jgi:DNA invertase Pin-like site-specific DNA recombinase
MKKAVIYVRGNQEKMQEIVCRLYASDKGYKILYATNNIEDVNLCNVMLISNPSRITRNREEYENTVSKLKARGIEVESVANQDESGDLLWTARELMN